MSAHVFDRPTSSATVAHGAFLRGIPAQLRRLAITRREVSGAFADLGLLIPLEASLIAVNGLNPTSTLLGVGVFYIAAGWYFRIPMPVQPLKALAAIAIAERLSPDVIAAGALLMSISLALLAVTGMIDRLYRIIPTAIVRGVQLGLAYILIRGAVKMLTRPLASGTPAVSFAYGGLDVPVMLALAPVVLLAMVALIRWPVVPASLAVLAVGVVIGLALNPDALGGLRFGPEPLVFAAPHLDAFSTAGVLLLTAQLPLTIANSVVATADTAAAYFPVASDRVTPRRLSLSIALGNLWAGFAGGLPVCHGSGGLTAHYSFGARRPLSTAMIGVTLIAAALMFGHAGLVIRHIVPLPFFGLLLLFVGIQHARLAMGVASAVDAGFVLLTGALTVAFDGNLAFAAVASMAAYWLVRNAVVERAARALYGRRVSATLP
jgi:MFS superfamily sulfate permease-like transporter